MPPQLPRRRKDEQQKWPTIIVSGIKGFLIFISLGICSFIGSWGIDLTKTTAHLREDVEVLKERDRMTSELIYPRLLEETRELKAELKEIRNEIRGLKR